MFSFRFRYGTPPPWAFLVEGRRTYQRGLLKINLIIIVVSHFFHNTFDAKLLESAHHSASTPTFDATLRSQT